MWVEIVLLLFLLVLLSLLLASKGKNYPPGPREILLIGNFVVHFNAHALKLREKYGDIFTTKFGAIRFVYLADFSLAKEAFSKAELSDRPHFEAVLGTEIDRERRRAEGIIFSNGKIWRRNRRFLLRHLRDLGMGKSRMEDAILIEAENLVKEVKTLSKEPSCLPFSINIAVLNVIWQLIASHRYDYHDQEVQNFMEYFATIRNSLSNILICDIFPILKLLPKFILNRLGFYTLVSTNSKFLQLVKPFIEEHRKKLDLSNPIDLMDDYLVELDGKKNEEYEEFSENGLFKCVLELFIAGNDTTSNMIHWIILYMAKFKDVQEEIQKEIDRNVPNGSLPSLEHRPKLPMIDAAINEVARHCSLFPFGLFRWTNEDVKLNGYFIPKGTVVQTLAGISHKDSKYWKDPECFNPKRFIDEDGKFAPQIEGFQAFGLGRRQCLGESLARMELYLFIGALLQNFTFEPPAGVELSISPLILPRFQLPNKDQKYVIKPRD